MEGLDGVIAAINEVSHENIALFWNLATFFKKLKKVVELTMNVTADSYGRTNWLYVALINQNFFDLLAEDSKVTFREDAPVLDSSEPRVDVVFSGHFLYLVLLLSCDACAFAANNL